MSMVGAIVPNMPDDRKVVVTNDWGAFFRVDYNKRILYVPAEKAMRMNHLLIDQFIDAVRAFAQSDLIPPDWEAIDYQTDEGSAERALELLARVPSEGIVACDIETNNLSWRDNALLSIGFAWGPGDAIIITGDAFTPRVLDRIQRVFNYPNVQWLWHNGKFDTGKLAYLRGLKARVDEDTMLMHHIGVNERRGTHGLKDLGAIYLQAPDWEAELRQIKKSKCNELGILQEDFNYNMFPPKILYKYAAFDVIITFRLYHVLRKLMRPEAENIYRIIIKASNVYRIVEANGAYLDQEYLEDLEFDLDSKLVEAQKHFEEAVAEHWNPVRYRQETGAKALPRFFNLKSPAQLKWLLSKVLSRTIDSTGKDDIDPLLEELGDEYPLLGALKELRKYSKYMDTYVMGLRKIVAPDGRIHSSYNLHGTETGRLSSSEPNMQNIPRDSTIKNLFIAAPGKRLVQLDYSQAELRVLAWLSQDTFLKGVYQRGEDLHDAVATQMFGPDFTKEQRVQAKTINFGIAYGRGASNIAKIFKMKTFEAQRLINNWFRQMPGVDKWIQDTRSQATASVPPTTIMGRERHFIITYENYNHVQNEAVNFPIQSIASDMTLISLLEIQNWITNQMLENRVAITITVHDSIMLEVDNDPQLIELVAAMGTKIMENVPHRYLPGLDFPFVADVETGYKWGDLHES